MGTTTVIPTTELLNTDGFVGKLLVLDTARFTADSSGAIIDREEAGALTVQISQIRASRVTPGAFDVLVVTADRTYKVLGNLFIHQIEDLFVGECDPRCEDCKPFRRAA